MKLNAVAGIVFVAGLVVCGIGWTVLPSLQDAQRKVDDEASEHVERARRLLQQYSVDLTRKSLLLDQLRQADVDIDVEDPEALAETAAEEGEYQEEHERAWQAYQPTEWAAGAREARADYGNIVGQIRNGLEARVALLGENDRRLAEALDAVGVALSITHGDASSRSHAEATRLKGVIQFHLGLAEWMRADAKRAEAEPYRRDLVAHATIVAELQSAQTLVADSGVDGHIRDLKAELVEAEEVLRERRRELDALGTAIKGLEQRLSEAESRAARAETALDRLKEEGVNFADPDGAEVFGQAFTRQAREYREALREIQALNAGWYPHARIDQSGDYLTGAYVENGSDADLTIEHGFGHYRRERGVLAARVEVEGRALEDLQAGIARLEGMKNAFQTEQERAARRIPNAIASAADAYDELNRVESEAFAIEEEALQLFDQSARTSKRAAEYARDTLSAARARTQTMSPTVKDRSAFSKREQDRWIGGHIAAQVADARLAKAWVYSRQYQSHRRNAEILAKVAGPLRLREADADSEQAQAEEAHDAGIEEITLAMAELQRAHRDVGRHWTVVAQEAGATYLMAMFGHPSYIGDAIQAYDNAVKGREDQPYAQPFVRRLDNLQAMNQ